jgi:hypothetical protein
VLPADGTAGRPDRALATQDVIEAIKHLGFTVVPMPHKADAASGLCSTTHALLVLATRLDLNRGVPKTGGPVQSTAIVSMTAFNCKANALDPNPVAVDRVAPQGDDAIRGAVGDALVLLPALPPAVNF